MKFSITRLEAQRSQGLRVIEEIPDYPLCLLEGKNGIGKSVGARLLELATGAQPYASQPHAWRTLRDQLGPTEVAVTGLPGERTILFRIDPQRWPIDPVHALGEKFASVEIDARPASVAEAHTLLRVRRISGDETLVQTLARDLDERAVLAETVARDWARPLADAWDHRLGSVIELVGSVSRNSIVDAWSRASAAASRADAAGELVRIGESISAAARDAASSADALAQRRRDLPTLLDALAVMIETVAQARATLEAANAEVEEASLALAGSTALQVEVAHWERLRGLRQAALQRERIRERQLLAALGATTRPSARELVDLVQTARATVMDRIAARDEVDLVKPRLQLAREIETPLAAANPRLAPEVIASTEPPLSVERLLAGVRNLRLELSGHPRPDELAQLDREIDQARTRLSLLSALEDQAKVTDRKAQRLEEAEEHLRKLFASLDASQRSAYESARQAALTAREEVIDGELRVRELRKQIAELLGLAPATDQVESEASRAVANEASDDDTEEGRNGWGPDSLYPDLDEDRALELARAADADCLARLARIDELRPQELSWTDWALDLGALRAAAEEGPRSPLTDGALNELRLLHTAVSELTAATSLAAEDAAESAAEAADAERAYSGLRASLRHAWSRLTSGSHAEWAPWAEAAAPLVAASGALQDLSQPTSEEPEDTELAAADVLDALGAIARGQVAAAFSLADRLATLSAYLKSVAADIAPRGRDSALRANEYERTVGVELREWVERSLAESLTTPELLAQLFDGAQDVRMHLDDLTLSWRPNSGGMRKRPLEAFSSGEQVFAYTRANLMRLRREARPGQSVVVVLDEFGAFVARDRFGQLLHFVENEALGTVAQQVIIMLPLSREYPAHQANVDETADVSPLAARGAQISVRGYFAVPFSSADRYSA